MNRKSTLLTRLGAWMLVLASVPASAATIWTVNSSSDPATGNATNCAANNANTCTLRDAFAAAQNGDTVVFDSTVFATAQTITLQSHLSIGTAIMVQGPGSSVLTLDGHKSVHVLEVIAQTAPHGGSVALSGMTLANGSTSDGGCGPDISAPSTLNGVGGNLCSGNRTNITSGLVPAPLTLDEVVITGGKANNGGGIFNQGDLTISNSSVNSNQASQAGGGIYNYLGALTLGDSQVKSNVAASAGGLYNSGGATLNNSTVDSNKASLGGGGIYNSSLNSALTAQFTLNGSTISNNVGNSGTGSTGNGGGIYNAGTTNINAGNSLSGNSAQSGGAIYNSGAVAAAQLTVDSSTLSANSATQGGGGGIYNDAIRYTDTANLKNCTLAASTSKNAGGAIYSQGTLGVANSTISANVATTGPGGIYATSGSTFSLNNSIVAGNTGSSGTDLNASNASWIGNVVNISATALKLNSLGNFGGATQTMPPLAGSPALGAGSYQTGEPTIDQRGAPRPSTSGATIDAGSVEVSSATPRVINITPSLGQVVGGSSVTITGFYLASAQSVSFQVPGGYTRTGQTVSLAATIVSVSGSQGDGNDVVSVTVPSVVSNLRNSCEEAPSDVVVTTPAGSSAQSAADKFEYVPLPGISGISPTQGPAAGGNSVTINFSCLTASALPTAVSFGSTPATSFTYFPPLMGPSPGTSTPPYVVATAPPGSGTVDVTLATAGGTSPATAADRYTYFGLPTVTQVSPNQGYAAGGTAVTITGTNFAQGAQVLFGSKPATSVTVASATQISASSPAGQLGTIDVTVTTPGGTSAAVVADRFTYIPTAYAVTAVAPGGHGSITPASQTVTSGSTASFTVTPNAGFEVIGVVGNTCTVTQQGTSSTWTTGPIAQACAVTAVFADYPSQCSGASNYAPTFFDDFPDAVLDPAKWTAYTHGGNLVVASNSVAVSAGTGFPYVASVGSPILPAGDFSVRWIATYGAQASNGTGSLALTDVLPADGASSWSSVADAWQDASNYRVEVRNDVATVTNAYADAAPAQVQHDVEYCWLAGTTEVWVDGQRQMQAARNANVPRPAALWFGNPGGNFSGPWQSFTLYYVEARALNDRIFANNFDGTPTP